MGICPKQDNKRTNTITESEIYELNPSLTLLNKENPYPKVTRINSKDV